MVATPCWSATSTAKGSPCTTGPAHVLAFTERAYEAGLGAESLNRLGFGLVFFDYDNDGLADIFVANGHISPKSTGNHPS